MIRWLGRGLQKRRPATLSRPMTPLRIIAPNLLSFGFPRRLEKYHSLEGEIERVKSLVLETAASDKLDDALEQFLSGYVTRPILGRLGVAYRARRVEDNNLWEALSDVWAPPPEFTPLGRFNEARAPLLYTATRPATAILEMRPVPRESFILLVMRGDWRGPPVPLMPLGIQRSATNKIGSSAFRIAKDGLSTAPEIKAWVKRKRIEVGWAEQDSFLSEIATASYDGLAQNGGYQLTNGIARRMQTAPRSMGLVYPSTAANYYGVNNALYIETADRILTPHEAWHVKLGDRVDGPGGNAARIFHGTVVRRGEIIQGVIKWGNACDYNPDQLHDLTKPNFYPTPGGGYRLVPPIM